LVDAFRNQAILWEHVMRNIFAAGIFACAAGRALAQTTPLPAPSSGTSAVTTPNTNNPTAPVAGANSFTEAQARSRIEAAGYTDVSKLT
jgi:hypothetical protein